MVRMVAYIYSTYSIYSIYFCISTCRYVYRKSYVSCDDPPPDRRRPPWPATQAVSAGNVHTGLCAARNVLRERSEIQPLIGLAVLVFSSLQVEHKHIWCTAYYDRICSMPTPSTHSSMPRVLLAVTSPWFSQPAGCNSLRR